MRCVALLLIFSMPSLALAQKEKSPPVELTLDAIYGPKNKVKFFSDTPPATRFVEVEGLTRLAIQKEKAWQWMDMQTGDVTDWQTAKRLERQLAGLPDVNKADAKRIVAAALGSDETDLRHFTVSVNKGLALIGTDAEPQWLTRESKDWGLHQLSPDGRRVAFVLDNDLYIYDIPSGERRRITADGSETTFNGRLDWVYQEEIYGRGKFRAFWWSPDAQRIAFLRLDDSQVKTYTLVGSSEITGKVERVRYPKAGDPIPSAQLWITDTEGRLTRVRHAEHDDTETLIVRVAWHPSSKRITYQLQNRIQSWLELREAGMTNGDSRSLFREQGPAWIEVLGNPRWLSSDEFLWLSDLPSGRRHVYRMSGDGNVRTPVTSGDWDVGSIVSVSSTEDAVFVEGQVERETQIFRVPLSPQGEPEQISTSAGTHIATVDKAGQWFTDSFSSFTQPTEKWLCRVGTGRIRQLGETSTKHYEKLGLAPAKPLTIPTRDGLPLPAILITPPELDIANPQRKVPLLVYTYGGPRSPVGMNRWGGTRSLWHHYLASKGIAVLAVDNRSSGGRGIADTWSVYRQFGVQELKDVEDVAQWLKRQDWADTDRLAMFGWSFGGFMTSYTMTHSKIFKAGIAGGPVTDWRFYDALYTERYMQTPDLNPEGYKVTSVVGAAAQLHGRLLLIHGEMDDNVHPANTLELAKAFQMANKSFDLMIYPGQRHGIRNPQQIRHMYGLMSEFLIRELKP